MRRFVALSVLCLFAVGMPSLAVALPDVVINFDDFTDAPLAFISTTALRDQYASKGVLFYGPDGLAGKDGGAVLDIKSFSSIKPLSGKNALAFNDQVAAVLSNGGVPVWPETITFDALWANVTIYVASASAGTDHFSLIALDGNGKEVVSSAVDTNSAWAQLNVFWADGIKTVVLSMDKRGNDAFVADNLELTTRVPEPATMLLLGLGLIGIGIGMRRKS